MPTNYKTIRGYTNTKNLKLSVEHQNGSERFRVGWYHEGYYKSRVYPNLAEALAYIQEIQAEYYPAEKTF
jgi:hypothetical protein